MDCFYYEAVPQYLYVDGMVGNRRREVALYIWNNLPDPTGTGKRYGFLTQPIYATREWALGL